MARLRWVIIVGVGCAVALAVVVMLVLGRGQSSDAILAFDTGTDRLELHKGAISDFDSSQDDFGAPRILIRLDDRGRQEFARFTERNIGRAVRMSINGKTVVDSLYIRETIRGGALTISGKDKAWVAQVSRLLAK